MEKKRIIRESYDFSVETYDARYKDLQYQKYSIMLDSEIINRINNSKCLFDLGVGTGLFKDFLKDHGIKSKIIGVDISSKMLKKAKKKRYIAVQGDVEMLPFKDRVVDIAFSFTSIQNVENIEAAIKEFSRILMPNGILILTILRKSFQGGIPYFLHMNNLRILDERDCGEDIGFVCVKV